MDDGWIEHDGKGCPLLAAMNAVDIKFRDGLIHHNQRISAITHHWRHVDQGGAPEGFYKEAEIIAYRVVQS